MKICNSSIHTSLLVETKESFFRIYIYTSSLDIHGYVQDNSHYNLITPKFLAMHIYQIWNKKISFTQPSCSTETYWTWKMNLKSPWTLTGKTYLHHTLHSEAVKEYILSFQILPVQFHIKVRWCFTYIRKQCWKIDDIRSSKMFLAMQQ